MGLQFVAICWTSSVTEPQIVLFRSNPCCSKMCCSTSLRHQARRPMLATVIMHRSVANKPRLPQAGFQSSTNIHKPSTVHHQSSTEKHMAQAMCSTGPCQRRSLGSLGSQWVEPISSTACTNIWHILFIYCYILTYMFGPYSWHLLITTSDIYWAPKKNIKNGHGYGGIRHLSSQYLLALQF